MKQYTITKVYATDKKKDGGAIVNSYGKPSWRVGIKTSEHGDEWLNGFLPFNPDKWEGSTQELEVYEEEFNGKMQKKFKLPPRTVGRKEFEELSNKVTGLVIAVEQLKGATVANQELDEQFERKVDDYPEIKPDDIPF